MATDFLAPILSLFYPNFCISCGTPGAWICRACRKMGLLTSPEECMVCRKPSPGYGTHLCCMEHTPIRSTIICWEYTLLARKIIRTIKTDIRYQIMKELGAPAGVIIKRFIPSDAVLIPIPTTPSRIRDRGFNQTRIIARKIGAVLDIPVVDLLGKVETAEHQTGKTRRERKNIDQDLFFFRDTPTLPDVTKPLVLVDDLCTTGSTLTACSLILTRRGFTHIHALALFRGKQRPLTYSAHHAP